mgnify:FL=1|jgi:NADH-quinone oxidoreductase subunit G
MPLLKIDDREIKVAAGTTVLDAALANDIEIPHYCYHPVLEIVGSCRMCMVEIEGMPKLQVSCNTRIGNAPPDRKVDGKYDMVVRTKSDIVKKVRENTLELLLLNHPLDCTVCDQAGECFLQDYSFRYGRAHSRFEDEKRVRPAEDLGAGVVINQNRCIMCTRCVRFTREISGTGELFVQQRGNSTKISVLEDKPLDNLLAGNVTDICPVGALLSKNYIHRNRIWNLDRQPSVCQECSVGCNVDIYHQNGEVFRTSARENLKVNGYFICDTGRYSYHDYEAVERVTSPMIRKDKKWQKISWDGAFKEIFEKLGRKKEGDSNKVAGIFSPFHTSEANFMFARLMQNVFKERAVTSTLPLPKEEEKKFPGGFRISGDRSPNSRGLTEVSSYIFEDIFNEIKKQKIKLMYALDDGVNRELTQEWKDLLRNLDFLVVQTYAMTPLAERAHLLLPGAAPLEREGTLMNDSGRIQWLQPVLPLQGSSRPDWQIVAEVMNTVGKRELDYSHVSEVLAEMNERIPAYEGVTFFKLGESGMSNNEEVRES